MRSKNKKEIPQETEVELHTGEQGTIKHLIIPRDTLVKMQNLKHASVTFPLMFESRQNIRKIINPKDIKSIKN